MVALSRRWRQDFLEMPSHVLEGVVIAAIKNWMSWSAGQFAPQNGMLNQPRCLEAMKRNWVKGFLAFIRVKSRTRKFQAMV